MGKLRDLHPHGRYAGCNLFLIDSVVFADFNPAYFAACLLGAAEKQELIQPPKLALSVFTSSNCRLLLGQGRPATVILDDALAFSDDDRIESMFDVLMRAGDKVQIIVLTCRKRLFTRLGAAPLEIRETA